MGKKNLVMYDTTLRDGAQTPDCIMSAESKLAITGLLHDYGMNVIEGGFVGANDTDNKYFQAVSAKYPDVNVSIFGRTADRDVKGMEKSGIKTFTVVGKSSKNQVLEVLGKKPAGYLADIGEYIGRLSEKGNVIYDAEFFFPAFIGGDKDYVLKTLGAAADGGAETLVLCDTTGMMDYADVGKVIDEISQNFDVNDLGVHFHNDCGLALPNTLEAIRHGVPHIQGTVNGLGERCGNLDLLNLIAYLHEKDYLKWPKIKDSKKVANEVSRLVGINLAENAPYVGFSAFAHSGGMHSDGNLKVRNTYQRTEPEIFGNKERYPISGQSGGAIIVAEAKKHGLQLEKNSPVVAKTLKDIEKLGIAGDAQLLSSLHNNAEGKNPFTVASMDVTDNYTAVGFLAGSKTEERTSHAKVGVLIGDNIYFGSSEGNGPVNSMDGAFREALKHQYPEILGLKLENFKVGVIPGATGESGTASQIKLDCLYRMNGHEFNSKTKDADILGASQRNIGDAYKYLIIKRLLSQDSVY